MAGKNRWLGYTETLLSLEPGGNKSCIATTSIRPSDSSAISRCVLRRARRKSNRSTQAERLLAELDPARIYPYEYICYRITNYRPESYPDLRLSGQEASHDLRLFVEDVSDAAGVPAEAAGEQVLTVEELAKQFNVSTKTISRWRRQGLVSRRFVMDGRKRVGFLQSSVDRFVERNQERVHRGSQFSQLTDEERATIIEHARRLARAGGCPPT